MMLQSVTSLKAAVGRSICMLACAMICVFAAVCKEIPDHSIPSCAAKLLDLDL